MPKHNNLDIYPFDPNIDYRDGLFGFDFNTGGKSKNFKLEHLRYFILEGLDPSNNGFLVNNGYTLVDNILTINAGWQWLLNGLLCTNEEDVVFTLEYTAPGFVRIDSIYANSNNELLIISGGESETIAVPPLKPINTLLAFSVNIFDTTIAAEEEPVLGNIYLKKIFDKTHQITASGTDVVIPFNLYGRNTVILDGAMTSISGFSFSDLVENPTIAEYPHEGKLILLINRSGHNITLKNADFASLAVVFFAFDGGNIVFPNNGKLFIKYTADGLIDILKSWTEITDVTGLPEALDLKADLVDGKVPSEQLPSYVDDVLEYANLAAFPITGEASKIYLALDTNFTYRWTGSVYVKISDTGKLDKVTSSGVERAYIINADGSQSTKPTSDFSGSSVQSVTGDSVDNTDPLNPIINAIPLIGTTTGNPVSGNIEIKSEDFAIIEIFQNDLVNSFRNALQFNADSPSFRLISEGISDTSYVNLTSGSLSLYTSKATIEINTKDSVDGGRGLEGMQDYTPNITDLDYVQKKYVDNKIGTLIRQQFVFSGSQTFTLSSNYGQVYSVEVQGQGALKDTQYTLVAPNKITILDTLDSGDYIVVLYSSSVTGVQPYYSQAETDGLLALKQNKFYSNKVTIPSTSVTGTTSETELVKITIPANTFSANDVIRIPSIVMPKIGVNNAAAVRLKISTSPTMPAGVTGQIAQFTVSPTSLFQQVNRIFYINGGQLKGFPFTTASNSDIAAANVAMSSVAFDVTQTQYLYISCGLLSPLDSLRIEGLHITNN